MHTFGGQVGAKLQEARETGGRPIGAQPEEILFTSCGTESDNTAIHAAILGRIRRKSTSSPPAWSTRPSGTCANTWPKTAIGSPIVPVDRQGQPGPGRSLQATLSDDTAIVSVMWANNETGVIFPIEEIAKIGAGSKGSSFTPMRSRRSARSRSTWQTCRSTCSPFPATSCTRPKASACSTSERDQILRPFLIGGHQEEGRRGGTENVPSIIGLGKACELAMAIHGGRKYAGAGTCATDWRTACSKRMPNSDGQRRSREPPAQHDAASASSTSRAKPSCSDGRVSASAPPPARPAPPAHSSPPTCCGPWACPSPLPTAPSASA